MAQVVRGMDRAMESMNPERVFPFLLRNMAVSLTA